MRDEVVRAAEAQTVPHTKSKDVSQRRCFRQMELKLDGHLVPSPKVASFQAKFR